MKKILIGSVLGLSLLLTSISTQTLAPDGSYTGK